MRRAAGLAHDVLEPHERPPPSRQERDDCRKILAAPRAAAPERTPGCPECGEPIDGDALARLYCAEVLERHERWRQRVRELADDDGGAP
jgi:hypothetical protein